MKAFLPTLLLLLFFGSAASAQNSVIIKQRGSGNKAVISQSNDTDSPVGIFKSKPCYETKPDAMKKDKNIIVLKTKDGSGKQVYKITGRKDNKLYLSQQGNSAEAVIGAWERLDSVAAVQNGNDNKIVLTLKEPPSSELDGDMYKFKQKGNTNFIYVGPCSEDDNKNSDTNSTIKINQKGEGNTAVVEQG